MRPRPAFMTVFGSLAAAALAATSAVAAVPSDGPTLPPPHPQAVLATDTDGDALPDVWETNGYDADGDGDHRRQPEGDGRRPAEEGPVRRDGLHGPESTCPCRLPLKADLKRIVKVFAKSPMRQPGRHRRHQIHLDAGPREAPKYNLGGGNEVPTTPDLNPCRHGDHRDQGRALQPGPKARIFHYVICGDSYGGGCSSGNVVRDPDRQFIVTVGPKCNWNATRQHQRRHVHPRDRAQPRPRPWRLREQRQLQAELPERDERRLPARRCPEGRRHPLLEPPNVAPPALNETGPKESSASARTSTRTRPAGSARTAPAAPRPVPPAAGSTGTATVTPSTPARPTSTTTTSPTRSTTQNNWANIVVRRRCRRSGRERPARRPRRRNCRRYPCKSGPSSSTTPSSSHCPDSGGWVREPSHRSRGADDPGAAVRRPRCTPSGGGRMTAGRGRLRRSRGRPCSTSSAMCCWGSRSTT